MRLYVDDGERVVSIEGCRWFCSKYPFVHDEINWWVDVSSRSIKYSIHSWWHGIFITLKQPIQCNMWGAFCEWWKACAKLTYECNWSWPQINARYHYFNTYSQLACMPALWVELRRNNNDHQQDQRLSRIHRISNCSFSAEQYLFPQRPGGNETPLT